MHPLAEGLPPPPRIRNGNVVGPPDFSVIPRFAGPPTFASLPRPDEVADLDVAIVGVPFDAGVSYRPGARFGPAHIRAASRLLRPYHQELGTYPFGAQQVVDCGDLAVNPFNLTDAVTQIESAARTLGDRAGRLLVLGGDHTIALPLLRAIAARHGPVAVVHFDAHLDTWDTYFGAPITHGTPFRRASEEGLLDPEACLHIGVRGPLYGAADLTNDRALGFAILPSQALEDLRPAGVADQIVTRVADRPVYISIDIDVLDPAFAPGTGTPEAGGLSSRELLMILRSLGGLNIVGADIVEVSPAYDHAEITAVAAAHIAYEVLSLWAKPNPTPLKPI